jgi:hypothetical protein
MPRESPFSNGPTIPVFGVESLPLTTIAHIITFLDDDVQSLARLCRTSRVLWYMTLPHLWKNVHLKSYAGIRRKDDIPEGFGSASPFALGLNALVTGNVANLVRRLTVEGQYGTENLEEAVKAGRIPENVMILNIALRAALDRCIHLESFRWDLNTRAQRNIYGGLSRLSRLESLWLRFPTIRAPQPTVEIPALPNLKSFTFTHFDPLCYPDDISTLIFQATKLEKLTMHFSPRMREQCEPSVVLTHFFRKNLAASRRIQVKSLSWYNLLLSSVPFELVEIFDPASVENCTMLNTFGPDEDAPLSISPSGQVNPTQSMDRMWYMFEKPADKLPRLKSMRIDHLHKRMGKDLGYFVGLEKLYLVNVRHKPDSTVSERDTVLDITESPSFTAPSTTLSDNATPTSIVTRTSSRSLASLALRDLYVDNICNVCGPTLKHLILPARWPLSNEITARLIRACPNLTQLAVALECIDSPRMQTLRLIMPFLSHLWAIRLLAPTDQDVYDEGMQDRRKSFNGFVGWCDSKHEEKIGLALGQPQIAGGKPEFSNLRYIGFGPKVFEAGEVEEVTTLTPDADGDTEVRTTYTRRVKRIALEDVRHVEIWKMDSQDIV